MRKNICLLIASLTFAEAAFAFDSGFVFGMNAHFSGSYTDIHIKKSDLDKMGANYLNGSVGFIMGGEANLTYIFDGKRYFHLQNKTMFGGVGLGFFVGVGQGFAGEISGKEGANIFINVFYTPVITLGTDVKAYFLQNRLIVFSGLGARIIADTTPTYDMYNDSSDPGLKEIDGVGTIIITKDMMKKMNAVGFLIRTGVEYVQPILPTTELVLGGYISYCIYKPKYIAMPKVLAEVAAANPPHFIANEMPLNSFFLNSFDFGLTLGINFRVNNPNI